MYFYQTKINIRTLRSLVTLVGLSFFAAAGCKPPQSAETASLRPTPSPNPEESEVKDGASPQADTEAEKFLPAYRTGLSPVQWLTKQNISEAEAKTVDALLESIEVFGGPSGNPAAAARWAEGRMQIAFLADYNLTEISPILVFKGIRTLYITGNKFTQKQFNVLIENLPNLKTVVKDPSIQCDSQAYPQIACLE